VNSRYNDETDLQDFQESTGEREISLNTATILGIFFLLALLCAIFFGFGYTMGRRTTSQAAAPIADTSSTLATNGSAKPAPGSAAQPTHRAIDDEATPAPSPAIQQVVQPLEKPAAPIPEPAKPEPVPAATTTPAGPPALVQVAAVSHQEDADTLINALKRRGYSVVVRHEQQDKLLHIQIGPLASKKDAEAMRQRLLSDGYNAIVK